MGLVSCGYSFWRVPLGDDQSPDRALVSIPFPQVSDLTENLVRDRLERSVMLCPYLSEHLQSLPF